MSESARESHVTFYSIYKTNAWTTDKFMKGTILPQNAKPRIIENLYVFKTNTTNLINPLEISMFYFWQITKIAEGLNTRRKVATNGDTF